MTQKHWLILGMLAILATAPGCVCCNHKSYADAREVGPECDIPLVERQSTYLFMVDGVLPGSASGLNGLRDELARQGYSKVGSGVVVNVPWMATEIRRLHAADPSSRFVLLGYDIGGPAAAWLANDLTAAGIAVDSLVLLDPVGKCAAAGSVRTVIVNSGTRTNDSLGAESLAIPDCGHFTLPTHPKTVAMISEVLAGVASRTQAGQVSAPIVEWNYEHALPTRIPSNPGPDSTPEWNFLFDVPVNQSEPLTPVLTPIFSPPPSRFTSLASPLHSTYSARPGR